MEIIQLIVVAVSVILSSQQISSFLLNLKKLIKSISDQSQSEKHLTQIKTNQTKSPTQIQFQYYLIQSISKVWQIITLMTLLPKPLRLVMALTLLTTLAFCLKQTQTGRNDWHLQHIGQLSHIQLIQNKLFYLTKENILGHLKLESGQIESRITLSPNEKLLSFTEREVTFLTDNNQVIAFKTHNLEKHVNNRFVGDRLLKTVRSYVRALDGKSVYINDDKNIRAYSLVDTTSQDTTPQSFTEIYTAQPNEIIQKLFLVGEKLYAAILTDNLFGFREIVNGKLEEYETILGFNHEEHPIGWSITELWEQQGSIVLVLHNKAANVYQTLVLTHLFQNNYKYDGAYHQLIGNQLKFCKKIYDLKHKEEVQKLSIHHDSDLNIDYKLEDSQTTLTILKASTPHTTLPKPLPNLKPKRVFLLQKSPVALICIIQYKDMTIVAHLIENGVEKQLWKREEGLAFIDKVLFMKYPFSDHLDNEYHRNLLSPAYLESGIAEKLMKVPYSIALRVREEMSDLIEIVFSSLQSLVDVSAVTSIDLKSLSKFTMSEEQELKLGLKKYIIAVTKTGAIFSIDTKSHNILWKKYRSVKNHQVIALMDLRKDYQLQAAVLITYNHDAKHLILQEIKQDGSITPLDTIPCPTLPSIHKLNHESIIITHGDKTLKYRLGESHTHEKHFYFYTQEESRIVGWKQVDEEVVEIWNFNLDEGERVVATASAFRSEQRSHIPLVDNGKVIFKNVDFTNLAVLTSKNATSMSLYVLNGMTGQVHFNEYRSGLNLNHPVNLAYDQNNVIVTYYNNRNKLYEVWTVEEYQQRIESSALNMIKSYLQGQEYKPSRNRENIIFLSEVYGSPVSIKKMFISESKESLIRRNLFVVTRDDKIYMIGRELVSTRRPKETALFSNQVYPPYQYLLPYDATKFFSYNIKLYNLQNVHFSATDMESTIFILAYGTDTYMIRVAPDMPFDMITEDFNYLVLVAIMVAVTVGVLVLRYKARKAKLTKPHRD